MLQDIIFVIGTSLLLYSQGQSLYNVIQRKKCYPVETADNFDLNEFSSKTWYSQMQQEVKYQSKDSFYCVTATYNLEPNRTVPLFNGKVISVYNYGNIHEVNGEPVNTKNGTILCARQLNKNDNSKLRVGLCNLPNVFTGAYWVIGYGPSKPPYEWIVVSGGQPTVLYKDGCTTQINKTVNSGLWIFSSTPIMPYKHLFLARHLLRTKGYTLSQLYNVEHTNCTYEDAFIKP